MAEIEQFIDPTAEAQIEKYLKSLEGIGIQYDKLFSAAKKTDEAITALSRSSDEAEKKQRKTNEVAKEAERLSREQAKAAESLEKQRQAAINAMGIQEAKERQLNEAITKEVKTLQDAITQNSALQKVKKSLDLTTDTGKKKLIEYNRTIDKNTEFIRHNSDMMSKQRMNIGNYAGSIREALSGLTSGGKGAAGALSSISMAGGPAGMAIAAVALASSGLGKVFTITNDLTDKFAVFTSQAKAATDFFFKSIASGDFTNFLSGMKDAIAAGKEYAETLDEIGDRNNAMAIQESKAEITILNLQKVLKDATKTDQERIAAADKILAIEDQLANKKKKIAFDNLKNELQLSGALNKLSEKQLLDLIQNYDAYSNQFSLVKELTKAEEHLQMVKTKNVNPRTGTVFGGGTESQIADAQTKVDDLRKQTEGFSAAIRAFGNVSDEERKKITDAAVAYNNIDKEVLSNTMRTYQRRQSLLKDITDQELKSKEDIKKANEQAAKDREDQLKREQEAVAASINAELTTFDAMNQSKINSNSELTQVLIDEEKTRLDKRAVIQGKALDQELVMQKKTSDEVTAEKLKITKDNEQAIADYTIKMAEQTAEQLKKIQEEEKAYNTAVVAENNSFIKRMYDTRVNYLKESLANGRISKAEYDQAMLDADFEAQKALIDNTIASLQQRLQAEDISCSARLALETELAEAQQALDNETTENAIANQEKRKEKIIEVLDKVQTVGGEVANIVQGFLSNESDRLEQEKERQLAAVGDNTIARERIEKEFAIKQAQIKRKQAIAEKAEGAFTIGIETAKNMVEVFPNPGLMALAAILGAAQLAVVLSKPLPDIPKFAKGTKSSPKGPALVAEAGRELLFKNGKATLVDKPTVVDLSQGTQVLTNRETERILQHASMGKTGYDSEQLRSSIESGNNRIISAITNKRELLISSSGSKITEREGNYYKTYYNRKIKWAGKS